MPLSRKNINKPMATGRPAFLLNPAQPSLRRINLYARIVFIGHKIRGSIIHRIPITEAKYPKNKIHIYNVKQAVGP
jgi:hypothetical protein